MRIAVVGPGALGCLLASKLFLAKSTQDEVLLIDHRPERAKLLNRQGIVVERENHTTTIPVPVVDRSTLVGPFDYIFSCVKSYDLERNLQAITPLFSQNSLPIFLQNGLGHVHLATALQSTTRPLLATTSEGATRLGEGHIRHAGIGHTYLGFANAQTMDKKTKDLTPLLELLNTSGLASSFTEDIHEKLWAKLFVNVGINALSVIHNCPNGELLNNQEARTQLTKLVQEAITAAKAQNISIVNDPVQETITVCKRTATNISSMLQDVRNKRPTEINSINGIISQMGRELHILTPENDTVITKIQQIQDAY